MAPGSRPNIIFIVLDTCRADVFYQLLDQGLLPGIEQIFSKAKEFRNARAVAPWTVPSHGSMFSGLLPTDHGTSANDPYFDPSTTPIAQRLQLAGYETVGLSANPWITPNFNFASGFERFKTENEVFWGGRDLSDLVKLGSPAEQVIRLLKRTASTSAPKTFANALYAKFLANRHDDGARRLTNDAIKWLSNRACGDPFFLFCNYVEPHLEYDPPAKYLQEELPGGVREHEAHGVNQDQWAYVTESVEMSEFDFEILWALYRAEIRYLDSQIARLFEELESDGLLDDTAIIVVSDHGENIGDHGLMDHQYCLYETLLQVPLVIRHPQTFDSGRSEELVETHRLYETVADIAGIDGTEPGTAPSLVDENEPTNYAIAEYTAPQPSVETLDEEYGPLSDDSWQYDRALRAIQTGRWKYIEASDGTFELYDLQSDPDELTPATNDDVLAKLRDVLETRRGSLEGPDSDYTDIKARNREQLRDLGYL